MTAGAEWLIVPFVLPLAAAALLLFVERVAPRAQFALGLAATLALLAVAVRLLGHAAGGSVDVYLLGNWPAPFGIALALDRLSALMLVITAAVALPALLYAGPRWQGRAPHFHAFFQVQLAGLNGAFLTADLFNLFVCFELLLIASYALLLHGAGARTLGAGFRYVVVNLVASSLFLVAVSLLYGVAGTLNLADLARKLPAIEPANLGLARAACLMLLVVFAVKAAIVPLGFWLPAAYRNAPAPVAALFALMTKVGVYAILRVSSVLFDEGAGPFAGLGQEALLAFGLATVAVAAVSAWAARRLAGLAALLVTMSAGTLVAANALPGGAAVPGAVFYLAHSAVIGAAMFLVADVIAERRGEARDRLVAAAALPHASLWGALFLAQAIALAGMPPFSGFIGKLGMLTGALGAPGGTWFWAVVLATSLVATLALARAGSRVFWDTHGTAPGAGPRPVAIELGAIVVLMGYGVALVVLAGPVQRFAAATAGQLGSPHAYVDAVLGARPVPMPGRVQ
ncbi:MAG TPA: monovalent cation/H+ antiporter subunit D [Casimicrobiaceae bacterium]|nr:monovalent cation/H+ antiporter subunit D [Casimicrobiaceae bacterium]